MWLAELLMYATAGVFLFGVLSVFVFCMTGKSLLWRLMERPSEEELPPVRDHYLEEYWRCNELYQKNFSLFERDILLGRLRQMDDELEKQFLATNDLRECNIVPYLNSDVMYEMKLGWRKSNDPNAVGLPIFYFEDPDGITFACFDEINRYGLLSILLEGFYETPKFATVFKCGGIAHPI